MLASPPELPSTGRLRLETSHLRRAFLVRAVEYGIHKLPLKEALLKHAKFVDVQQRTGCGVEDALHFADRQGFHIFQDFNILNTLSSILIMVTKQILNQFFTHGALFRFQELLPFHGPEEQDKVMALFHCMVRYGSARLGTAQFGSVAFPPQFSTAIEWASL